MINNEKNKFKNKFNKNNNDKKYDKPSFKSKKSNDYKPFPKQIEGKYWIYGKHPVICALKNPDRIVNRILCTKNTINFLKDNLSEELLNKISTEILEPSKIDRIIGSRDNVTHQGIAAEVNIFEHEINLEELADLNLIVALDKITDPHNIGAIMRTSAAFGTKAIITQEKNSPPENATIAKTSAGTIELVKYLRPSSLWKTIEDLKEYGFKVIGLDGTAELNINELNKLEKIILVIGSEGNGLSPSIVERCDYIAKIDISSQVESLNASVAAAIALYALK
jgi:23S rRNA (guanosine2251-2'-O)-methyltransferase